MVISIDVMRKIDASIATLPPEEREKLARYGALVLTREMESRLELAKRKMTEFEKKYGMTLERLNQVGLPENARLEEHEDYVEWSGWETTLEETTLVLGNLRAILEATHVGHSIG